MRYVTFSLPGDPTERLGAVVRTDWVVDVRKAIADEWPGPCPGDLLSLIQAGPEAWQRAAALLTQELPATAGDGHRLQDVRVHAPITRPRKNIFCLGRNYKSHIEEAARARDVEVKLPEVPVFFTKAPTSINGPYDAVPWDPAVTQQVDYEVELAVIIGVRCKNVARADALDVRLRLHDHQRRVRAGPAEKPSAVVQGQEPRRLLPDGPGRRHRRRVRRSAAETDLAAA